MWYSAAMLHFLVIYTHHRYQIKQHKMNCYQDMPTCMENLKTKPRFLETSEIRNHGYMLESKSFTFTFTLNKHVKGQLCNSMV